MKRYYALLIALLFAAPVLAKKTLPPLAETRPYQCVVHGDSLYDDYHWLQDRDDAALWRLLAAEEKYYKSEQKGAVRLGKKLYKTHRARQITDPDTFPFQKGDYRYFSRRKAKQLYYAHYRQKTGGKAELILDENRLAKGKSYFDLGDYAISSCHRYLAYCTDETGDENYRLFIKDLHTGKTQATGIEMVSDLLWLSGSPALLFSTVNSSLQTDLVWYMSLGEPTARLLHAETNPAFNLSLYKSSDESRIFLAAASRDCSEIYHFPANEFPPELQLFAPRMPEHLYWLDYYDGRFIIESNLERADGKVYTATKDFSPPESWQTLIDEGEKVIAAVYPCAENLLIFGRQNGFEMISIHDLETGEELVQIQQDEPADYGFWHYENGKSYFYYSLESDLQPYSIWKYDLATFSDSLAYQAKAPRKYDKAEYSSSLLFATALDGTQIPLRIKHRRDLDLNQPQPLLLSGYGAYGSCEDPYFSLGDLILMDLGVIIATAHPRGGGEMGDFWHKTGKLLNKTNTFTDFIACARYLIDSGYTRPKQLGIYGGSAGGLLIGAVLNEAPQLFGAAWLDVPFVDALSTMLDDSLPLTTQEHEEWGNPAIYEQYQYIKSYSPVNNVKTQSYPPILISSGLNDVRVGYWEGLKYAQLLRKHSPNPVLFELDYQGHAGSSNRFDSLRQYYRNLAWLLLQLKDNY